ncbi:hypothetical protein BB561_004775 [Smittium simulii]|uniref:Proteasome assembly chaperone 2 n=1 Tax=Smittium simulii TaxID=133385 RepID=A0A2T9YEE9_9FUNG|nr:hypothetical protein BB561_004775 [Smittium simulii]
MFFKTDVQSKPFSGSTLIIPVVSIGNVPQLAADLIIATEKMQRVGTIDSCYVYSFSSEPAYEHCSNYPTAPIEVYQNIEGSYTIIQFRSPCLKNQKKFLAAQLIDFYKEHCFKDLVFLASSNASFADDSVLSGSKIKAFDICNAKNSELLKNLERCEIPITKIYNKSDLSQLSCARDNSLDLDFNNISLSHNPNNYVDLDFSNKNLSHNPNYFADFINSGFIKHLIKISIDQNIPANAIIMFANEGGKFTFNNIPEAITFASLVNTLLNLLPPSNTTGWTKPLSWKWLHVDNIPQNMFY